MATPSKGRLPIATEARFPNLRPDNYHVTSPRDRRYNCIAWAIDSTHTRFWPATEGYRWPSGILQSETMEAFVRFFELHGYRVCGSSDLEPGVEKIAIYADGDEITHAAKQLPSGHWSSKIGWELEDIEHYTLSGLEGGSYGRAVTFLKRSRSR